MKLRHDHNKSLMENKYLSFVLLLPVIMFALFGLYYMIQIIVGK